MAYTADDILTLARAGFNAKQISILLKEPAPTPAPAPVPTPAPAPAPDPVAQKLDDIMKLMQASNILNINQPKQDTIEDIVAEIISPNNGGVNNGGK